MGGKSKRKRTYVYLWLIHTVVWWKPAQPCKAIILQLEINFKKSPTEFLNDTLWTPDQSLPSPHQIPSPKLFCLHPFCLCPRFPFVIQPGLPGFLSFPSDCYYPETHPLLWEDGIRIGSVLNQIHFP